MSDSQKALMAQGRRETRIVEAYLRQLEAEVAAIGQRTVAEIAGDLKRVETDLESASIVNKLALFQEREDLQREAMELAPLPDGQLEEQFVAVARNYSERKGVSYSSWREVGVRKEVLDAARIPRSRRPNRSQIYTKLDDDSTELGNK